MNFSQYTIKKPEEVLEILKSKETGISNKEANRRQRIYGFNEIKIKETTLVDILIRQFKSPFFYLLFIAATFSFLVGERINGFVILAFVFINVLLGFFQETRAVKAAAILKKYISLKVRVLREEKEITIDQKFLVPGDIVLLEAGNIVPADLRALKTNNFLVNEEVLSGESIPVDKNAETLSKETKEVFKAKNIIFAASSVISGKARGVVVGTGRKTYFGEVAKLTVETNRESAYEKGMLKFSRLILRIVLISIILIFFANLIIKGISSFFVFLIFCIALVVSIIPEALPAVITFALSRGVMMLAKRKVVVKRISAIEDLGDIEVLCTDKTGTLTKNRLILKEVFSPNKEKCLLFGLLSSDFIKKEIKSTKNPFDLALFRKASQKIKNTLPKFKEISEIPFDSNRLRTSVFLQDWTGKKILIIKGAPEVVLDLSLKTEGGEEIDQIRKKMEKEGKEGKRVLAIAFKEFDGLEYFEEDERDLTFLGFFSFIDPLKITAKPAAELSKKLGVQLKILTGDSFEVAGAVAKKIGLIKNSDEVVLGETLDSLSKEDFEKACRHFHVFARVSPELKFKIVKALQKKFEVGFLGEGINDAPSLKLANVGIAVREGADVSREVSDIILLKKDLRLIVDGIKIGRNIFSNINKYIKCTLSSNFGNFYSIAAISLFIPFLPMLPIQILLVNFISDFPLITIATDKVDIEELKKPKLYQLNQIILLIILLALVSTIFDFIFFGIFHDTGASLLQTLWFIESIITEIFLIYLVRTRHFFLKTKRPSFPLIIFSILAITMTIILPFSNFGKEFFNFVSPPLSSLLIILCLVVSYFIISEIIKLIYFRYWENNLVFKEGK